MKSVLISIKPKYCRLIVSGEKTIEVRKTRSKLDTPFKCYIYCTKNGFDIYGDGKSYITDSFILLNENTRKAFEKTSGFSKWNGKVMGEFVCDKIIELAPPNNYPDDVGIGACLTREAIITYLKGDGYAWHISNLVFYDKPKELREFKKICIYRNDDGSCQYKKVECGCVKFDFNQDGSINLAECVDHLSKPPKSWMYVEEAEE